MGCLGSARARATAPAFAPPALGVRLAAEPRGGLTPLAIQVERRAGACAPTRPAPLKSTSHIVGAFSVLVDVEPFDFDLAADTQPGVQLGDVDRDRGTNGGPCDRRPVNHVLYQQIV